MKFGLQAYRRYLDVYINRGPGGKIFGPFLNPQKAK